MVIQLLDAGDDHGEGGVAVHRKNLVIVNWKSAVVILFLSLACCMTKDKLFNHSSSGLANSIMQTVLSVLPMLGLEGKEGRCFKRIDEMMLKRKSLDK